MLGAVVSHDWAPEKPDSHEYFIDRNPTYFSLSSTCCEQEKFTSLHLLWSRLSWTESIWSNGLAAWTETDFYSRASHGRRHCDWSGSAPRDYSKPFDSCHQKRLQYSTWLFVNRQILGHITVRSLPHFLF
jgi:hypothetical protein